MVVTFKVSDTEIYAYYFRETYMARTMESSSTLWQCENKFCYKE